MLRRRQVLHRAIPCPYLENYGSTADIKLHWLQVHTFSGLENQEGRVDADLRQMPFCKSQETMKYLTCTYRRRKEGGSILVLLVDAKRRLVRQRMPVHDHNDVLLAVHSA